MSRLTVIQWVLGRRLTFLMATLVLVFCILLAKIALTPYRGGFSGDEKSDTGRVVALLQSINASEPVPGDALEQALSRLGEARVVQRGDLIEVDFRIPDASYSWLLGIYESESYIVFVEAGPNRAIDLDYPRQLERLSALTQETGDLPDNVQIWDVGNGESIDDYAAIYRILGEDSQRIVWTGRVPNGKLE